MSKNELADKCDRIIGYQDRIIKFTEDPYGRAQALQTKVVIREIQRWLFNYQPHPTTTKSLLEKARAVLGNH